MTIHEQYRVQNSALIAALLHGLLFGLYFILDKTRPEEILIITEVAFFDAKEVESPTPAPAPQASQPIKSIKDFLKMALPQSIQPTLSNPNEIEEMPIEKMKRAPDFTSMPKLIDKSKPIEREIKLESNNIRLPRTSMANMSEMTSQKPTNSIPQLALAEEPGITLEAVGQKRVSGSVSPAIQINPKKDLNRSNSVQGLKISVQQTTSKVPQGLVKASSLGSLDKGGPARKSALPSSSIPRGYGRSRGGISLGGSPVSRPQAAVIPAEVVKKTPNSAKKALAEAIKSGKGVEISGPVAQRKVLKQSLPSYPAWASAKGVEAEVVIRFYVSPDGNVQNNLFLERTSGYKELDTLSMEALKEWLFVALPPGSKRVSQWGIITFRFRLK